ncbi:MurR/RpiR family transcriptional regulator [Streptomyces sp. NPDC001380]|uniref:MurR/RpiR family transcriptional regulator n=1 Tax=Streptomyces sp. NPDC001380 TaxID=3364566 RepID=UPI0036BF48DB
MRPPLAPTPVLTHLRDAAGVCGQAGARLFAAIAADYPASLEERPARLLRSASATAADLERLLATAGFTDTDDLRLRSRQETGLRLAAPDLRFTEREGAGTGRTGLRRAVARERENLGAVLDALQSGGALELAAEAVLAGRRRWVLGDLGCFGHAVLFADALAASLRDVTLVQPGAGPAADALCDAHVRDVLVVFALRPHGDLAVRAAREFHALGATVVAVTDDPDGPLAEYAAHVLAVAGPDGEPLPSPAAVTAVGHLLSVLAAAGAKGASRRERRRAEAHRALAARHGPDGPPHGGPAHGGSAAGDGAAAGDRAGDGAAGDGGRDTEEEGR